ncbi:MAG: orotidine-5'-phosphate decarboxylase [Alphaproteobacteria bacterium]|nr:orotidine-5'-phosphate decarboxylase [Alphaproteobacteria bacterium]
MSERPPPRLFVALDLPNATEAGRMAKKLAGIGVGLKIGLELFVAEGPAGVRALAADQPLFLDLKLHDIPNTVAGAVKSALALGPTFLTVHAGGGRAMMQAAAETVLAARASSRVIAVTVLTSLDQSDLSEGGIQGGLADHAVRMARLAKAAGLAGVVCSPHEVKPLRAALGRDMLLVVPGVRPAGAAAGDQKRVMTPAEARAAGADVLVIGRPIVQAPDPRAAARAMIEQIAD